MKNSIYAIAMAALFIFGCKQSPTESDPMRVNDPNNPSAAKTGTSDACFDIPTPTMSSATQGDEIGEDTYGVTVCWSYTIPSSCNYYTSTVYYPQGTGKPARHYGYCPTSTLNPLAENNEYEFWGGSQQSIVNSPAYSGHYEVYRSTDGGTTWTKLVDTRDLCYTDDNGGAGFAVGTELVYSVKEKSLEVSTPNECTHHSLMAEGIGITIEDPCDENAFCITIDGEGEVNTESQTLEANNPDNAATYPLEINVANECNDTFSDVAHPVVRVYLNDVLQEQPGGSTTATYQTGNQYHFNLQNPNQGGPYQGTLTFTINGNASTCGSWTFQSQGYGD